MKSTRHLTPRQKAAIFMLAVGTEASAGILEHLGEQEMELLTREMAALGRVSPEVINTVTAEFRQLMQDGSRMIEGGVDVAQEILERAVDKNKASDIIERVKRTIQRRDFHEGGSLFDRAESDQLREIISSEHPQTVALVMTQINPSQAASLLLDLPEDLQKEVVYRISTMEPVSLEIIREVEESLGMKVASLTQGSGVGGARSTANILNIVGKEVGKTIIEDISQRDEDLATEIESLLFVFDDLKTLDDKAIQRVLRDVEKDDLALALKGASEDVKKKIMSNMSEGAREQLEEDISYMGPVRRSDVEEAQKKIVDTVRKLEESNEIMIPTMGGLGDEIIE